LPYSASERDREDRHLCRQLEVDEHPPEQRNDAEETDQHGRHEERPDRRLGAGALGRALHGLDDRQRQRACGGELEQEVGMRPHDA
jgi:hypothetical protein